MLIQRNKEVFGRVATNINALEDRMQFLETGLQKRHNLEVEEEYLVTKGELECWENFENTRLSQIAKKKCFTEGEKNTKFFHATINQRRSAQHQCAWKMGSYWPRPEIHEGTVNYFQAFLIEPKVETTANLEPFITEVISGDENAHICRELTNAEIKSSSFSHSKG